MPRHVAVAQEREPFHLASLKHLNRPLVVPATSMNGNAIADIVGQQLDANQGEVGAEGFDLESTPSEAGYALAANSAVQHGVDRVAQWQCLPDDMDELRGPGPTLSGLRSALSDSAPQAQSPSVGSPKSSSAPLRLPRVNTNSQLKHTDGTSAFLADRASSAANSLQSSPSAHQMHSAELGRFQPAGRPRNHAYTSSDVMCESFLADRGAVPAVASHNSLVNMRSASVATANSSVTDSNPLPHMAKPLRCLRLDNPSPVIIGTPPRPITFLN